MYLFCFNFCSYFEQNFTTMKTNFSFKELSALLLLLCLSFSSGHAQWFHLPGFLQRYEIGYSYSIANATYKSQYSNGANGDTTLSKNVTSTAGIGAQIGFTIPITRIGGKCMLALGLGYQYNMYTWDYKTPNFDGSYKDGDGNVIFDLSTISTSAASLQMGLPISADFKFGNDAFLRKNQRWGCTFGAGVLPVAAVTADFDNAGFGFGAAPFVKAEVSFFAGICFKLRGQYAIGYLPFYDAQNSLGALTDYAVKSSLTGKQQMTFSLILMPFSFAWQEHGWWNTY